MEFKIEAPFKPTLSASQDVSNFDAMFTGEEAVVSILPASEKIKVLKQKN